RIHRPARESFSIPAARPNTITRISFSGMPIVIATSSRASITCETAFNPAKTAWRSWTGPRLPISGPPTPICRSRFWAGRYDSCASSPQTTSEPRLSSSVNYGCVSDGLRPYAQPLHGIHHIDRLGDINRPQPRHPIGVGGQALQQLRIGRESLDARIPTVVVSIYRETSSCIPQLMDPQIRLHHFKWMT